MRKLYGRSKRNERCHDAAPGSWETSTMISSLRLDGSTECIVFDGAIDKPTFRAYMKEALFPVLCKGDIVILDNLSSHKDENTIEYFESHGIKLLFLPAYSPDLNPTEKMWSKVKGILRETAAEDPASLFEAIRAAFARITSENAKGWFKICGYFQF